jgi:mono/diheme cytochrome c family protein|tara:strand:+ start:421 stop:828 length:408 start_codon:yes stop_codon:yes gene_type:complete
MKKITIIFAVFILSGCFDSDSSEKVAAKSIELGENTFNNNCAVCHGAEAKGLAKDWKKRQEDGNYPAPPLNGTAHAWHHSPEVLLQTINEGGVELGGWMPPFKSKLSDEEKQSLLDYIQNLWPIEIQQKYNDRFK